MDEEKGREGEREREIMNKPWIKFRKKKKEKRKKGKHQSQILSAELWLMDKYLQGSEAM